MFYALVALFLVIGSGVVFYAEGWRWNFGDWRPEKVGEIYVRSYPSDATLSLNGKPVKNQTGFLSPGTLITDLLPRTYDLALNHPGYEPWHEKASVLPAEVAQFTYAVLVPKEAVSVATSSINAFALTAAGPLSVAMNGDIVAMNQNISLGAGTIIDANPHTTAVILQRPSRAYVLRDIVASTTINLSSLFSANGINLGTATNVTISPYDATLAIAGNQSHVWLMNLATQGIVRAENAAPGYIFEKPSAFPRGVAWSMFQTSKNVSSVRWYDDSSGLARQNTSIIPGQTEKLGIISGFTFAVLQNDGELYRYNASTDSFTKIADDVVNFGVSPDGTMLAAVERASMEIFSLKTNDYWRLNLADENNVEGIAWYRDDTHLFIIYPDRVAFLDLNDAALANFTTVTQGSSPAYDASANALYAIDPKKHLARFDFPD